MKMHSVEYMNFTSLIKTTSTMNNAITYIIAGAIFDTFGDVLMKNWVMSSSKFHFISGMLFYIIGLSFLAYSFSFKNMVVASMLFLVFNVFFLSLVNWLHFNEALNSREITALMFGLIAIVLFEFK
jgi:multidrug transporter EmrE-like cation transporter